MEIKITHETFPSTTITDTPNNLIIEDKLKEGKGNVQDQILAPFGHSIRHVEGT